jgi:NADPH:quinone reductase-like Zn-dependent oxidoreductase
MTSPSVAETDSAPQRGLLVSVGMAQQSIADISADLQNKGYSNVTVGDDRRADSATIGYRHPLNDHWSIDSQYLDQGKVQPTIQATPPTGKTNAQAAQEIAELHPDRGQGFSVVAVHHHPVRATAHKLATKQGS